ncbi:MAG: HEPN domain-containing protein [Candidatus Anstonellales archaeon]
MGEFLKIRADRFLETAKDLYNKGYYDLCSFNIEQAVQLYLKFSIWKYLGDFEKTHNIKSLLQQYKKLSNQDKEIEKLINEFEETINDLEIAYIESRYIPAEFTKKQVDLMFEFVNNLRSILQL